jgi:hypothetical protein
MDSRNIFEGELFGRIFFNKWPMKKCHMPPKAP